MDIKTVCEIVGPIVVAAVPAIRAFAQMVLTPKRLEKVHEVAQLAVRGAEQMSSWLPAVTADPSGAKLNYATNVVLAGAKRLGVKLSSDEALAFVNAALREMESIAKAAQ